MVLIILQVGIHTVRHSSRAADDEAIKVTLQGMVTFGLQNLWSLGFVVVLPLAGSSVCASIVGDAERDHVGGRQVHPGNRGLQVAEPNVRLRRLEACDAVPVIEETHYRRRICQHKPSGCHDALSMPIL